MPELLRCAIALNAVLTLSAIDTASAKPSDEVCVYATDSGEVKQVHSRGNVPSRARKNARCFSPKEVNNLAKPEDMKLRGNVREENISSPVGTIHLRWPRKVEELFGRTPLRAVADAARTVARAVNRPGFPTTVQRFEADWQIVFLDEEMPDKQVPLYLVSNCHPGWMTPPANIYIVAQRVAAGCSGRKVTTAQADSQLAETTLHEFGHAVEYYWLSGAAAPDRMRAEGFATWFERYAAEFSTLANAKEMRATQFRVAKASIQRTPTFGTFTGSAEDYFRASMYFEAVVARKGILGLAAVYDVMRKENLPLVPAIGKALNWNEEKLNDEIAQILADY